MILFNLPAAAHSDHGSEVQIRVFDDEMRIVIRTSLQLAWARLGGEAPERADDAGRQKALPLLIAAAPAMIVVKAGGKPLQAVKTDFVLEVDEHAAFVLVFERPEEWPVEVDGRFVTTLGDLDTGTILVFDHTGARFVRDLEPIAHKEIGAADSRITFDLKSVTTNSGAGPVIAIPQARAGAEVGQASGSGKPVFWWALLIVIATAGGLLCRRLIGKQRIH
jgi:hypothetical protein